MYLKIPSEGSMVLDILTSQFTDNVAIGNGGAVSVSGGQGFFTSTIDGVDFSLNSSKKDGGGLHAKFGSGQIMVSDTTFRTNEASSEGALHFNASDVEATNVQLTGVTIDGSLGKTGCGLTLKRDGDKTMERLGRVENSAITGSVCDGNNAGAVLVEKGWAVDFDDVDLGTGATDNTPRDIDGCDGSYGAGMTFFLDPEMNLDCPE